MQIKKRVALVGTGGRGLSFIEPVVTTYRDGFELVALCDSSATRLAYYQELLRGRFGTTGVSTYAPASFPKLLTVHRPDLVIVSTPDCTHHQYIIDALEAGADVITEKPMTIDAERCRQIFEAISRSGKSVRVAFNYRWGQFRTKVKEVLESRAIGTVKSVNLEYLLDTSHGADYFRRWHSDMSQSGGLLVHKSTHHFDLVNWWLDAIPASVFAYGDLVYYGKENAVARGEAARASYPRYTGEAAAHSDPFKLDLASTESFRRLYLEAEKDSGYIRDQNVFRAGIDIFDQMSALVRYRSGETLTYSLVAFSPREGMRVTFNGDRGRLEYHEFVGSHMNRAVASGDFQLEQHGSAEAEGEWIRIFPHFAPSYRVDLPANKLPHGGADAVMQENLFGHNVSPDPWHRGAGHEQGAASMLVGVAANTSIACGQPVRISDLFPLAPTACRLQELL